MVFSETKGVEPVTHSKSTTPTDQRSASGPTAPALACSGDMYSGVPRITPCWVNLPLACATWAMPKSRSLAWASPLFLRVTKMFPGLMSRCTILFRCASASAASTSMPMLAASLHVIVRTRWSVVSSASPSRSSSAM